MPLCCSVMPIRKSLKPWRGGITGNGTHFGHDHPPEIEWAELICRFVALSRSAHACRALSRTPAIYEATTLAFRHRVRGYSGRSKIVRFEGHFHGWHDEVMHGFQPPFDADGSLGIPSSSKTNIVPLPAGDLQRVADVLQKDCWRSTAVIVEPSAGGSWGRIPLDPQFLHGLQQNSRKSVGVLLIFDEVITGFRWSPGGAQQQFKIMPDITCMAKIVAGGMPGGAVGGRAEIMKVFDFTGDPRRDRLGRVGHQGTFNRLASVGGGGGVVTHLAPCGNRRAHRCWRIGCADLLRPLVERRAGATSGRRLRLWRLLDLPRLPGTDCSCPSGISKRHDVQTNEANRLNLAECRGALIAVQPYQRHLRHRGVDVMSSTGGITSSSHTEQDIAQATTAFEATVVALLEQGLARHSVDLEWMPQCRNHDWR